MKRGRKFVASLEDQKKAFLPYKNLFQSVNNVPVSSHPVFKKIKSALPRPISEKGLYLSVKKNFNYFFDVTEMSEGANFKCSSGTTQNKESLSTVADKSHSIHKGFSCNVCSGSIVGFRYVCVQCAHYSLCASCESRGEHSLHYVLRIPRDKLTAEVGAMLSQIRAHLRYGLDTEQDRAHLQYELGTERAEHGADRVVPALHEDEELEMKVEIKEELRDPLEHEDELQLFQPGDNYTEPEYSAKESTSNEETPASANASTTIITETEEKYIIIKNPVRVNTEPKTTKHKNCTKPDQVSKKRRQMYYKENVDKYIRLITPGRHKRALVGS